MSNLKAKESGSLKQLQVEPISQFCNEKSTNLTKKILKLYGNILFRIII